MNSLYTYLFLAALLFSLGIFGVFQRRSLIGMLIAPYMALVHADVESKMLLAQKIMYFHVPSAWAMYAGFFLVFVFSILYLWKRNKRYDIWATSAANRKSTRLNSSH